MSLAHYKSFEQSMFALGVLVNDMQQVINLRVIVTQFC